MSNKLFDPGAEPSDLAYINIRDGNSKPLVDANAFTESLWSQYERYADSHFLKEVQINFNQRFWEMYLTCSLLEKGFKIDDSHDSGPDICINNLGGRTFIEATAPQGGDPSNSDAVPEVEFNSGIATKVPSDQIDLRLLGAIKDKGEVQYGRHLKSGHISKSDCYVVAINGRDIPHTIADSYPPRIIKALFGIGNQTVEFNPQSKKITETSYTPRPTIQRASGNEVDAALFTAGKCPHISAVIYSRADAANGPVDLGDDYVLVHNPFAKNPLPLGMFKMGEEYVAHDKGFHFELEKIEHHTK